MNQQEQGDIVGKTVMNKLVIQNKKKQKKCRNLRLYLYLLVAGPAKHHRALWGSIVSNQSLISVSMSPRF